MHTTLQVMMDDDKSCDKTFKPFSWYENLISVPAYTQVDTRRGIRRVLHILRRLGREAYGL